MVYTLTEEDRYRSVFRMAAEEALKLYSADKGEFLRMLYGKSNSPEGRKYGLNKEDTKRIWRDFKEKNFESILGQLYNLCFSLNEKKLLDQIAIWIGTTDEGSPFPPYYVFEQKPEAPAKLVSDRVSNIEKILARTQASAANVEIAARQARAAKKPYGT